jgi:hypothetical protein
VVVIRHLWRLGRLVLAVRAAVAMVTCNIQMVRLAHLGKEMLAVTALAVALIVWAVAVVALARLVAIILQARVALVARVQHLRLQALQ